MGELRCVDGSLLGVVAIPCHDQAGQPYEVTLRLALDRQPFAVIGQRCGHQLAALAAEVQAARADPEQVSCWPDPDDRFPVPADAIWSARARPLTAPTARAANSAQSAALPAAWPQAARVGPGALAGFQPGESEYFTLRSKDREDLPGRGEMRCVLRSSAQWHSGATAPCRAGPGHWQLSRRAVLEAWGDGGTGVRAVLTSAELVMFLDTVLSEPDGTALAGQPPAARAAVDQPGRPSWPAWRLRGRVPDGSARSCLPALRTAA